jgi:hypothetical protein
MDLAAKVSRFLSVFILPYKNTTYHFIANLFVEIKFSILNQYFSVKGYSYIQSLLNPLILGVGGQTSHDYNSCFNDLHRKDHFRRMLEMVYLIPGNNGLR